MTINIEYPVGSTVADKHFAENGELKLYTVTKISLQEGTSFNNKAVYTLQDKNLGDEINRFEEDILSISQANNVIAMYYYKKAIFYKEELERIEQHYKNPSKNVVLKVKYPLNTLVATSNIYKDNIIISEVEAVYIDSNRVHYKLKSNSKLFQEHELCLATEMYANTVCYYLDKSNKQIMAEV